MKAGKEKVQELLKGGNLDDKIASVLAESSEQFQALAEKLGVDTKELAARARASYEKAKAEGKKIFENEELESGSSFDQLDRLDLVGLRFLLLALLLCDNLVFWNGSLGIIPSINSHPTTRLQRNSRRPSPRPKRKAALGRNGPGRGSESKVSILYFLSLVHALFSLDQFCRSSFRDFLCLANTS